jgi:hypothetical protein
MQGRRRFDRSFAWLVTLLCLVKAMLGPDADARDAHLAYVDPGIGSFIVQGIVAFLAGAAMAVRHYRDRILKALGRAPREDAGTSRKEDDDADA